MDGMLRQAGEQVLDKARKKGVAAEVFLLQEKELAIDVVGGQVETLKQAEESGLGLRVFHEGRLGFTYSNDLSKAALEVMVENAINIARYTVADENNVLPGPYSDYPALETFDEGTRMKLLKEKIDLAQEVEAAARQTDSRLKVVERAGYQESEYDIAIMNSEGLWAVSRGNDSGLYIFLVAEEDGDAQTGFSTMMRRKIDELDPVQVGQEAARQAVQSLHARKMESACIPCIMDPWVVTRFLGILAQMIAADAVQKGKSLLAGKLGNLVAAPVVELEDDATYPGGIASFPFDGEGVPSRRNVLISGGVLQQYLYDTYTACKDGTISSGNARRGSYRSLPGVGTTNFILKPGTENPDQMLGDIDRGLYITEVMGMHTANPISGDFSIGASGMLIEKGQLMHPVRGITVAGNLVQLLGEIDAVGNNLRFFGGRAAPSIRLQKVSIAGK